MPMIATAFFVDRRGAHRCGARRRASSGALQLGTGRERSLKRAHHQHGDELREWRSSGTENVVTSRSRRSSEFSKTRAVTM